MSILNSDIKMHLDIMKIKGTPESNPAYNNTLKTAQWTNLNGGSYTATLANFNFTSSSGWIGTGITSDPYRLRSDGANDFVLTNYVLNYDSPFSIRTKIRIPTDVNTTNNIIFSSTANSSGAWIPYLGVDYVNKKVYCSYSVFGFASTNVYSNANLFNAGDIIDLFFIYKTNKAIEVWLNNVKVIDTTFTSSNPTSKPYLCTHGSVPYYQYPEFYKIEMIEFMIFNKALSSIEINRIYKSFLIQDGNNLCNTDGSGLFALDTLPYTTSKFDSFAMVNLNNINSSLINKIQNNQFKISVLK